MGVVYQSIHSRLKKQVVLKLLLNKDWDNTDQTQRFYREMELVGQLDHPNIVKATDAGEADDTCFLVMEFLNGHDLKTILKQEGPLSITAACSILRQAANGLQYIHNHDLIHRDIKPSNLFLTTEGQVKILDLGLAGLRHEGSSLNDLTDTNCIMGSAYYMAPEQAQSIKTIDQRSDIYSLGCTFYQLLTGQVPFRRDTPVETIIAHREDSVPILTDHLQDIPVQLEELFQSMVKKNPDDRIQTMAEVVKVLDEFLINKSEQPLNEASDTYMTESQELKELCLKTVLTPPVEAQKYYSSTQYQPTTNRKKTILLVSTLVIFSAGLLSVAWTLGRPFWGEQSTSLGKRLPLLTQEEQIRKEKEEQARREREELLRAAREKQAIIEREAANWALSNGGTITVRLLNRERIPDIDNIQLLPKEDFNVIKISFVNNPHSLTREFTNPLVGLSKLLELDLADCPIKDDALSAIYDLITLQKLDIHETGITDKGLSHIGKLKNLTHLSLQINPNITDEGLQILNQLQKLESINLTRTNLSDKGLKFIQNNPKIEWLSIKETQVSDKSVKHLINLKSLKDLFLKDTKITAEGIIEIRQAFEKKDPISFE